MAYVASNGIICAVRRRYKKIRAVILRTLFSFCVVKRAWYGVRRVMAPISPTLPPPPKAPEIISWGHAVGYVSPQEFLPRKVWTYWSGSTSQCAEACQKSWHENTKNFDVIVLNDDSVKDMIPDFPDIPAGIPIQLKSDLIRLTLMERYGGIWIDYSIMLTKPIDWIANLLETRRHEVLAFYNECPIFYRKDRERPIIENGLLAAFPRSEFIHDWRDVFLDCLLSDSYRNYFKNFQNYNMLTANFLTEDLKLIEYLSCYVAAQCVMLSPKKYRILLLNAEDDFYHCLYKTRTPGSQWQFAEEILFRSAKDHDFSSIIKIPAGHRRIVDEYIKYRVFKDHSLLGQYLNSPG